VRVCVCVCVCVSVYIIQLIKPTPPITSSSLPFHTHSFFQPKKNLQFSVLDKASAAGVKGGEGREGEDGGAGGGEKELTAELAKYGFRSQAHVRVLVSMYKARQFLVVVRFCCVCCCLPLHGAPISCCEHFFFGGGLVPVLLMYPAPICVRGLFLACVFLSAF